MFVHDDNRGGAEGNTVNRSPYEESMSYLPDYIFGQFPSFRRTTVNAG
jgi:hypothetical protein